MDEPKHKHKRRWIAAGLLLLLCWVGYRHRPLPLGEAPEWQGLVPGQTTATEVTALWGPPEEIVHRQGHGFHGQRFWYIGHTPPPPPEYTVYKYLDPVWGREEVWLQDQRVVGVLVLGDWSIYNTATEHALASYTVKSLAREYGRPDMVLWSSLPYDRCLVWARFGVVGHTFTPDNPRTDDPRMDSLLWFTPMSKRQFLHTEWPWPPDAFRAGCAVVNPNPGKDRRLQDPFLWEVILSEEE